MQLSHTLYALILACLALSAEARDIIIDVRTPAEYSKEHIPESINIDYSVIARDITKVKISADDRIILYCRSGRRSGIAQEILRKNGFRNVENYGGLEQARKRLSKKS